MLSRQTSLESISSYIGDALGLGPTVDSDIATRYWPYWQRGPWKPLGQLHSCGLFGTHRPPLKQSPGWQWPEATDIHTHTPVDRHYRINRLIFVFLNEIRRNNHTAIRLARFCLETGLTWYRSAVKYVEERSSIAINIYKRKKSYYLCSNSFKVMCRHIADIWIERYRLSVICV